MQVLTANRPHESCWVEAKVELQGNVFWVLLWYHRIADAEYWYIGTPGRVRLLEEVLPEATILDWGVAAMAPQGGA